MNNPNQAIDAVITWVDGADNTHVDKVNHALSALGFTPRSAAPTRFASKGEIYQCVRSIHKFAPFMRKIFIVTDNQRPDFENQYGYDKALMDKIQIVDHKDIFRDHMDYLPTFNSRSIEAMLYRIPGLSEHYVYFNDDMSLIKSVKPGDFFSDHGPILRGKYENILMFRFKRWVQQWLTERLGVKFSAYKSYGYKLSQVKAAELAGFDKQKVFLLGHDPHPLRRSTFEQYFDENPEILEINLRDKFRTDAQFNVAALAYHLEILNGTGQTKSNRNLLYLKPKKYPSLKAKLDSASKNPQLLFCCIQSLDKFSDANQTLISQWIEDQLKVF